MRKAILMLLLAVVSIGAFAGDFDDGVAAYERKDYATALKIFRSFAAKNNPQAQYNLGIMYQEGQGVPQDYEEAIKWYRMATEQGEANAQSMLGVSHDKGQSVAQDYEDAIVWYRTVAEQGNASAQLNLGAMYHLGHGVIQDNVRAHMWSNLAAASGNADAVSNREFLASLMTSQQIAEAQRMARDCLAKDYKGCD
ncbi:MAG: tetratricopeptide repeat protein [Pseudomonadota bacterium]